MVPNQLVEKIAKHEELDKDSLLLEGISAYLLEKKREYLKEKFEILTRYRVVSTLELKKQISRGKIEEHPAWEDFIESKNIDSEIKEIDNDLKHLQKN